jgi:CRISPR-associated protein Cmr5
MTTSMDQRRAEFAWQQNQKPTNDFVNLAQAAPSLIMNNGLMQTLAFYSYKAKKEQAHRDLLETVVAWLGRKGGPCETKDRPTFQGVMNALLKAQSATYFAATEEALEILRWVRHFAKAREKES